MQHQLSLHGHFPRLYVTWQCSMAAHKHKYKIGRCLYKHAVVVLIMIQTKWRNFIQAYSPFKSSILIWNKKA
jgi:hypothetical protein